MNLELLNAGRRFNDNWIFRNLNYTFTGGGHYGIRGDNGSGKSTLLKCLAGLIELSEGEISSSNKAFNAKPHQFISICTPYVSPFDSLSIREIISLEKELRKLDNDFLSQACSEADLNRIMDQAFSKCSNGQQQRLKLALAFSRKSSCYLFDEPCTNLDQDGVELFQKWVGQLSKSALIIIAGNREDEMLSVETLLHTSMFLSKTT